MTAKNLDETLKDLGYSHRRARTNNPGLGKHVITDSAGQEVGRMTAWECWQWLKRTGQITEEIEQ